VHASYFGGIIVDEHRILAISDHHVRLTIRQCHVAAMLPAGATAAEIASQLSIETSTVRKHIRDLLRRTSVKNLHGLSAWSYAHRECCLHDGFPEVHQM
jgi:DNA-binding NarL/FixJ family response regulator